MSRRPPAIDSDAAAPTMSRQAQPPKGLTLIELLVVVAVISVLIAVLVPTMQHARQKVRRLTCQAHLREVAQGWSMYLDDHDERFLTGRNSEINYGGVQGEGAPEYGSDPNRPVDKPVNPYLHLNKVVRSGADVFHCPADAGSRRVKPSSFRHYGTSYMMNHILVGQGRLAVAPHDPCRNVLIQISQRLERLKRSNVRKPSRLLLLGDFGWYASWYFTVPESMAYAWHGDPDYQNMAYLDGHVDYVRIIKGVHTTADYTLVPFEDLQETVVTLQVAASEDG